MKVFNRVSAKFTIMFLDAIEKRPAVVLGGLMTVSMLIPLGFAFAGISNTGNNVLETAKSILQPIGALYGGWHTYQAFSSDHDKGKHVMKATGGFLIALWDNTINTIKGLIN